MHIKDKKTQNVLFNALIADTFLKRVFGLLKKPHLKNNEALIFYNAQSIHTFGMEYPIDVVFLDKKGAILTLRENVNPSRIICCLRSRITIELNAFAAKEKNLSVGQALIITK